MVNGHIMPVEACHMPALMRFYVLLGMLVLFRPFYRKMRGKCFDGGKSSKFKGGRAMSV